MKASPESQLYLSVSDIDDTDDIRELRKKDDYQGLIELGNALSEQYRFREAASVWSRAAVMKEADAKLYLRIGGAYLTTREFEDAINAYKKYLSFGGSEKDISFPMGIRHYLMGEYQQAAHCFEQCLPCDEETLISVIYWHCLCCLRSGDAFSLLTYYHPNMDIGHHTAYNQIVSILAGETRLEDALPDIVSEPDDLNYCISAYGAFCIMNAKGKRDNALLQGILKRREIWPCIAYLAAWNDSLHIDPEQQ